MNLKKAAIIAIGDELLIGDVIDTNSAFIGRELTNLGVAVRSSISISDEREEILNYLAYFFSKNDILIVTGGLGPTQDDITKKSISEFFDSKLIFREDLFSKIESFFQKRNIIMAESNREQAIFPEKAKVIANDLGTASGMHFSKDGKHLFSLPGVPYEMKAMMRDYVLPFVKTLSKQKYLQKIINTYNISESRIYSLLDVDKILEETTLAFLPSSKGVRIRLSARGAEEELLKNRIEKALEIINSAVSDKIVGYDNLSLSKLVFEKLKTKKMTISFAESCTGGKAAAEITNYAGSSEVFKESFVTYSNSSKMNLLGVAKEILAEKGAVSKECVREMVLGLEERTNADITTAISGIAGPSGGTVEKPVGTVYFAVKVKGRDPFVDRKFFVGSREHIRERAVSHLYALVYEIIK